MLDDNRDQIIDYKISLMESFKKSDQSIKLQILDIFYSFVNNENFDDITQFLLTNMI